MAVLAAAAATGWVLARESTGTHRAVSAQAPAAAITHSPVIARVPAPVPARILKPVNAVSFGPYGYGHGDNNRLAPLAIDSDPAMAWKTAWYSSAHFGNLQSGTGLLLDMGRAVTITRVGLLLGSAPGANFQLRVGTDPSSLRDLLPAAYATDAGGRVDLKLSKPAHGRYVLIWFTELPPASSGTFQASVSDISLEGWT